MRAAGLPFAIWKEPNRAIGKKKSFLSPEAFLNSRNSERKVVWILQRWSSCPEILSAQNQLRRKQPQVNGLPRRALSLKKVQKTKCQISGPPHRRDNRRRH